MENVTDKLDLTSLDLVSENIKKIAEVFPNCVTETANGRAIDFDLLKQELKKDIVEGNKERYRLEWPGKKEAIVKANLPTTKTLRPVREDSVDFDNTENLYIEGDNLEVLKLLQESYLGKIKMIYIDPPYNTGNDFVYKDTFAIENDEHMEESGFIDEYNRRLVVNPDSSGRYHSDWLSMLYPRLKLARNLLVEKGLIFISIDDNEVHNTRKLCDEVFGELNFIDCVIWKKRYGGGAKEKFLISLHEYVLVYAKNINELDNFEIPLTEESILRYYKLKDENYEARGHYRTHPLEATKSMGERKNLVFGIEAPDGSIVMPKRQWLWGEERVKEAVKNGELEFIKSKDGAWSVHTKQYLKEENGEIRTGKPFSIIDDVYTQHGTNEIIKLFGNAQIFSFPKPTSFLKYLINVGLADKEGIILDFFSGSAATADAIMQLNYSDGGNRKYILVQIPESTPKDSEAFKAKYLNICEIGKERIRRAIKQLNSKTENNASGKNTEIDFEDSRESIKNVDLGFRVYRLDDSNMKDVYYRPQDFKQDQLEAFADNIKPDRTADDLLVQIMLDWGLPLSLKIEQLTVNKKQVYKVAENSLLACFDSGLNEAFAKEVSKLKPLRVVFKDSSFEDNSAKENVKQLLKQLSPETEMKVI
ncbi:MAG: site-specific DNA-methyltransferase [Bacteroidota bacterium]|nr:site-specific DNA-methyltransferase [Bacteroidota bacterium]MDP3146518.1 site-specific DNA-methyltransferase [Bacteroidota bacterium]